MKIKLFVIDRKFMFIIAVIIMCITLAIGYSYINTDLIYNSSIYVSSYKCSQNNLYNRLSCMATTDSVRSKYVNNNLGINFSKSSSNTNGKGLYTLASTLGTKYPIHYFRGGVENNNVKFGDFCWKIVRTTETGGTKLIYNGSPDTDGHCTAMNEDTYINNRLIFFHERYSLSFSGYMVGKGYKNEVADFDSTHIYSKDIKYENGKYSLVDYKALTDVNDINSYHFTCFSNSTECKAVNYVHSFVNNKLYYITLNGENNLDEVLNNMVSNSSNSFLKENIDNWYVTNMSSFSKYLEDTVWCNDRSYNSYGSDNTYISSGWNLTSDINKRLYFSGYGRSFLGDIPTLSCASNDSYTMSETNGNGKLQYPVATLTIDEVIMAGAAVSTETVDSSNYLNTGKGFWTLTPSVHFATGIDHLVVNDNFTIISYNTRYTLGVRPAISLRSDIQISGGIGSKDNPYTLLLE